MKNRIAFGTLKLLLTQSFLCSGGVYAGELIKKIEVEGNKRIESDTVEDYLKLKVGDEYTKTGHDDSIRNLYSTGLFENVNIEFSKNSLIVRVEESGFVSSIVISGNSKIKESVLLKELLTKPGDSLSSVKIQSDVAKIKEMYKKSGRFATTVSVNLEKLENNRVKVIFDVNEGPKTGIKRILFVGNNNYKDGELKSIILTKESKWFKFLETNDTYDPDRIEYDKELIKSFYQSVGFAEVDVISATAELSATKEYFTVTYLIEEGRRYSFGDIKIENLLSEDFGNLYKFVNLRKGRTFNMDALEKVCEKIEGELANMGYPQISVYPKTEPNAYTGRVNVTLVIDKASKVFVDSIEIAGNIKTLDRVIRREFKIMEGDVFDRSKIDKGIQNLRNLDYFEKINPSFIPTKSKDRYKVRVEVEEKSTSSIGLEIGYSNVGGVFGRLSFLERNFAGTGKVVNAGVRIGKKSTSYYGGITDPKFMDRDLSLGFNFFKDHSGRGGGYGDGEQNYSLNSYGMKTSLGYDITEYLSHDIDYLIKQDKLSSPGAAASRFIMEQMGKYTTSALGHTFTYDRTDSRILPKNGYLLSATEEYAGLGGNNKYLKHDFEAKGYLSFANNKYTIKVSSGTGYINGHGGKNVRISDRFNLGDHSLRGFAPGGIGPRDKLSKEGFGGRRYYRVSTELNFPTGLPEEFNVTGAAFVDIGSVWGVKSTPTYRKGEYYDENSARISVGCGFLWITKIAPIRVDWAIPIKKKTYDEQQRFHISFSTNL